MNFVDSLNLFGVEAKEVPCIKGKGAPTTATAGAIGSFYMDTDTGNVYKCTAVVNGVYTWNIVDGKDGYTPQKGVDYFDGTSVTHEWDGTVLKITSASGSSSADLKGEKGDTGATGTSVTITSVVESSEDGGSNIVTFSDGKSMTVKNGSKGNASAGYIGKKLLFMGDSITQRNTSETGWVGYFNEIVKPVSFVNIAVSGARWCDYDDTIYDGVPVVNGPDENHNNTMGNQVEIILRGKDETHENYSPVTEYDDFDMIFIAAGTNDADIASYDIEESFVVNNEIVNLDSLDKTIFASAFRYCVESLQRVYPNADIFICTPIQSYVTTRNYAPTKGKRDHLIDLCQRMSIPYIDTFMCGVCGIYEAKSANGKYLIDGLHPNVAGAKKIARYNAKEIINYYSTVFEETKEEDLYTNILETAGYTNDTYLSSTTNDASVKTGYVSTGFIPVVQGQTIYSSGSATMSNDTNCRIFAFDANKTKLWHAQAPSFYSYSMNKVINLDTGDLQFTVDNSQIDSVSYPTANVAYVRLSLMGTGENLIITVDEPIK